MTTKTKTKPLYGFRAHILLPDAWADKLSAIAARRSMRVSELIRQIIRAYLEDEDRLLAERERYDNQGGRQI